MQKEGRITARLNLTKVFILTRQLITQAVWKIKKAWCRPTYCRLVLLCTTPGSESLLVTCLFVSSLFTQNSLTYTRTLSMILWLTLEIANTVWANNPDRPTRSACKRRWDRNQIRGNRGGLRIKAISSSAMTTQHFSRQCTVSAEQNGRAAAAPHHS